MERTAWGDGGSTNALILVEPVYMKNILLYSVQPTKELCSSPGLPIIPASSEPASLNLCRYLKYKKSLITKFISFIFLQRISFLWQRCSMQTDDKHNFLKS